MSAVDQPREKPRGSPFAVPLAAAMVAGATLALQLPALPAGGWLVAGLVVGVAAWLLGRRAHVRVPGALLAGFALCGLHAAWVLSLQLPVEYERSDLVVSGKVLGLPEHDDDRTRFLFRVDRSDANPGFLHGRKLLLACYDGR